MTVKGILEHERAFQRIANENGGTRASGTPGYDVSAKYVADRLRKAGLKVTTQQFTFPFFAERAPATLAQVTPTATTYETGTFDYSGSGDVTGRVVPIDTEFRRPVRQAARTRAVRRPTSRLPGTPRPSR